MFLGNIFNLFIGLALTFGTMGLAVSSITEGIASVLKLRSATMLAGLREILNDNGDLSGLAGAVLTHGAVNPQLKGNTAPAAITKASTPAYIPPQQFAVAMIDVLQTKTPAGGLAAGIASLNDPQLETLFNGMLAGATTGAVTNIADFGDSVANWFDNAMDRLGGGYKRQTQLISLLIGLALAVMMNVDSIAIAQALWSNPQLSLSVTGDDPATAATGITKLNEAGFPFGWTAECKAVKEGAVTRRPSFCAGPQGGNGVPSFGPLEWLAKALGWAPQPAIRSRRRL